MAAMIFVVLVVLAIGGAAGLARYLDHRDAQRCRSGLPTG